MLTHILLGVEYVPQFRSLVLGVPLAEFVAVREYALLGAGLLLITACTTASAVKFMFGQGVKQRYGLQLVAAGVESLLLNNFSLINGFLHGTYHEVCTQTLYQVIAIDKSLGEIVAGIYVYKRERYLGRVESLVGKICKYN